MKRLRVAINIRWLLLTLWLSVMLRTVRNCLYNHIWFPYRFYYHVFLRWLGNLLGRAGSALNDKSRRWMMTHAIIDPPSANLMHLRDKAIEEGYGVDVLEE